MTKSQFESAIAAAGGVDLQIMGIGADGQIAFNEPGSSLASRTRVNTLTEQTRRDNARSFSGGVDEVSRHCLTQGLGTIMDARHALLIATGVAKAEAVHHLVEGPVSARWPATVLQHRPHATVLIDDAAASRLELSEYFRWTSANKPEWQGLWPARDDFPGQRPNFSLPRWAMVGASRQLTKGSVHCNVWKVAPPRER